MKFLKCFLCLAVFTLVFAVGASAQTPDSLEFPDDNEYWVIYFDEQNGAIMLGTASVADSCDTDPVLSWGEYLDMLDPIELENTRFYYLSEDGDRWIAIEDYEPSYDFARRAIASNVPVYSYSGVIYLPATEYDRVNYEISSAYKSYCARTDEFVGEWVGTYGAPQGKMGVELYICRTKDLIADDDKLAKISQAANGVIHGNEMDLFPVEEIRDTLLKYRGKHIAIYCFYPSEHTPQAENGVYISVFDYVLFRNTISAVGTEWIAHRSYAFAHLSDFHLTGGRLTADVYGNYSGVMQKVGTFDAVRRGSSVEGKTIAVFATDRALTVQVDQGLDIGFAICLNGSAVGPAEKMALTISNPETISVSDFRETEIGQAVTVTGLQRGTSHLTATDPKSGASQTVSITVTDDYSKNYSYSIYEIAEFYPTFCKNDSNVSTNIYNLSGMYVRNYQCVEGDDGFLNVSFDVYNTKYLYGAVEVYDENDSFYTSAPIKKYQSISSLKDTVETSYHLITGLGDGTFWAYNQPACSKCTGISLKVPAGGKVVITNNPAESAMVAFYNFVDYAVTVANRILISKDSMPLDKEFDSLMAAFFPDPTELVNFHEFFSDMIKSIIIEASTKLAAGTLNDALMLLFDGFERVLADVIPNFKNILLDSLDSVTEKSIELLFGPFGKQLDYCFSINKASDFLISFKQFKNSINNPYATLYSDTDGVIINKHGVVVYTDGNIDTESTLQVFKVYKEDLGSFSGQTYELYNISFVKDDKYVQPNGKVEVRIPVPIGMKLTNMKVYRQETDGTWTPLSTWMDSGYLIFETDHFSLYAVVGDGKELKIESAPSQLQYEVGDSLDVSGLSLTLDGVAVDSGYVCSPLYFGEAGNISVTVFYGGESVEFDVTVTDKQVDSDADDTPTTPTEPNDENKPQKSENGDNENGKYVFIIAIAAGTLFVLVLTVIIIKKRK